MMCAYALKPESKKHGWLYRMSERGFDGLLHLYEAGLKIVLRHRFTTLMVMFGNNALTGYLYVVIPKGFFPQQDTGRPCDFFNDCCRLVTEGLRRRGVPPRDFFGRGTTWSCGQVVLPRGSDVELPPC
jgi:AcrB/AcrD/AcrF family